MAKTGLKQGKINVNTNWDFELPKVFQWELGRYANKILWINKLASCSLNSSWSRWILRRNWTGASPIYNRFTKNREWPPIHGFWLLDTSLLLVSNQLQAIPSKWSPGSNANASIDASKFSIWTVNWSKTGYYERQEEKKIAVRPVKWQIMSWCLEIF